MTLKEARKLAIKKWRYIVDNDGREDGLFKKYPALELLKCGCSYCQLFDNGLKCVGCPLNILHSKDLFYRGCNVDGHPWDYWASEKTKENAQKVLDLIIKMSVK